MCPDWRFTFLCMLCSYQHVPLKVSVHVFFFYVIFFLFNVFHFYAMVISIWSVLYLVFLLSLVFLCDFSFIVVTPNPYFRLPFAPRCSPCPLPTLINGNVVWAHIPFVALKTHCSNTDILWYPYPFLWGIDQYHLSLTNLNVFDIMYGSYCIMVVVTVSCVMWWL